jgi:hypothetical protein
MLGRPRHFFQSLPKAADMDVGGTIHDPIVRSRRPA